MPSIRIPSLRAAALRPAARSLPARMTQPFLTQVRCATRDEKWYEPNDGGKHDSPPKDKGKPSGYNLDGTSTASNKKLMMYAGVTLAVVGIYAFMMARPDSAAKKGIEREPDAMHNMIPSDQQRRGGPIRSA